MISDTKGTLSSQSLGVFSKLEFLVCRESPFLTGSGQTICDYTAKLGMSRPVAIFPAPKLCSLVQGQPQRSWYSCVATKVYF